MFVYRVKIAASDTAMINGELYLIAKLGSNLDSESKVSSDESQLGYKIRFDQPTRLLDIILDSESKVFCSAWSRSQVRNQSFGPKQNTKLTCKNHPPPTENFLNCFRLCMGPRFGM